MKTRLTLPCLTCRCGYEWFPRPKVERDPKNPKKIIKAYFEIPKVCTECKSPYAFSERTRSEGAEGCVATLK